MVVVVVALLSKEEGQGLDLRRRGRPSETLRGLRGEGGGEQRS